MSGFVSDQSIPITIDIENGSSVRINRIRVILRQSLIYTAYHPWYETYTKTLNIAEIGMGHIDAHSSDVTRHMFKLTTLQPDNLYCDIIRCFYELQVFSIF